MKSRNPRPRGKAAPKRAATRTAAKPRVTTPKRPSLLDRCLNIADLEEIARRRLKPEYFAYYASGAEDERTVARNRLGFDRYVFLPRVLAGVGEIRTATTVLGTPVSTPILLAPAAYHCLADREGEVSTARAASAAGSLFAAGTLSTRSLEDIAAAATGPLWFQLYVFRDRALAERLIRRAEVAGYRALVLTVDTPRLGRRERSMRATFQLPRGTQIANLAGEAEHLVRWDEYGSMSAYAADQIDPTLTWEAVDWLRRVSSLPIVLKGIMRADDAARAVDSGVEGIWVSNHGGRQLDGEEASILALPAVVAAVRGRAEVYMDGGIRRGTDVLKALALGARAVFIGRAYLWGLAAGGEPGVERVLEMLKNELEIAMSVAGASDVTAVDGSLVIPA